MTKDLNSISRHSRQDDVCLQNVSELVTLSSSVALSSKKKYRLNKNWAIFINNLKDVNRINDFHFLYIVIRRKKNNDILCYLLSFSSMCCVQSGRWQLWPSTISRPEYLFVFFLSFLYPSIPLMSLATFVHCFHLSLSYLQFILWVSIFPSQVGLEKFDTHSSWCVPETSTVSFWFKCHFNWHSL